MTWLTPDLSRSQLERVDSLQRVDPCSVPCSSRSITTVDGRDPTNQLIWYISHYLHGFSTIPGGCLGFLPSTVLINNLDKHFSSISLEGISDNWLVEVFSRTNKSHAIETWGYLPKIAPLWKGASPVYTLLELMPIVSPKKIRELSEVHGGQSFSV